MYLNTMARGPRAAGPPVARGPMLLHRLHRLKAGPVDHADVIFRTGPRVTYMVLAGDMVPTGTALVTLEYKVYT